MRFGRYETLVRLGRGGMAEVFAARLSSEAGFAKLVAVKRMLPHLSGDAALTARFLDEARVAALVTSPHVVQTLDVGRSDDGQPFIVLELVLGVSLAQLLSQRPLPSLPVRLELVTHAALGLADVHDARAPDGTPLEIVHRDVSPHNVLVGSDGRARLSDFGIARANIPREETRTGVVLGKFGYMPPEQLRAGAIDARSDVYAMGAVAWEALTGRRLHADAKTPEQVTKRILAGRLPSIAEADPTLPPALVAVVERAMQKDPRDRFANGRELAEALRVASRELGPLVPRATLIDEVRRAAGRSLSDLESALAELDDASEEHTATLGFEGATVSGLLGVEWDPHAQTAPVAPDEPTITEPETIADARPIPTPLAHTPRAIAVPRRGPRPIFWVALLAGTVALGAAGAALGAMWAAPDPPPARPVPAIAPPTIVTEPTRAPVVAPTPEPEPVTIEEPPPRARPRSAQPHRASPAITSEPSSLPRARPRSAQRHRASPAITSEPSSPGPLLGADRFDQEAR